VAAAAGALHLHLQILTQTQSHHPQDGEVVGLVVHAP